MKKKRFSPIANRSTAESRNISISTPYITECAYLEMALGIALVRIDTTFLTIFFLPRMYKRTHTAAVIKVKHTIATLSNITPATMPKSLNFAPDTRAQTQANNSPTARATRAEARAIALTLNTLAGFTLARMTSKAKSRSNRTKATIFIIRYVVLLILISPIAGTVKLTVSSSLRR